MTREKQIAIASCAYGSRGSSIDFSVGAKWADSNPKSPWISVEDDLPCNHKELIDEDGDSQITKVIIVRYKDNSVAFARMAKHEGQWKFLGRVTHWFPIPELPKE